MDYEEYLNKERTIRFSISELIEENKELKSAIKELHCKLDELEKSKKDSDEYLDHLIGENYKLQDENRNLKAFGRKYIDMALSFVLKFGIPDRG